MSLEDLESGPCIIMARVIAATAGNLAGGTRHEERGETGATTSEKRMACREEGRAEIGECTHTSVVEFGDGPEPFLPRRVPDLQPNDRRSVDINDAFGQERCAYCRLCRRWCECVLHIAVHKRSLADALAAEHYNLGFEAVGHIGALSLAGEYDAFAACRSVVLGRVSRMGLPVLIQGLRLSWWLVTKESESRTSLMARSEQRVAGKRSWSHKPRRQDAKACCVSQAERAKQKVRDCGRARLGARSGLLAPGSGARFICRGGVHDHQQHWECGEDEHCVHHDRFGQTRREQETRQRGLLDNKAVSSLDCNARHLSPHLTRCVGRQEPPPAPLTFPRVLNRPSSLLSDAWNYKTPTRVPLFDMPWWPGRHIEQ